MPSRPANLVDCVLARVHPVRDNDLIVVLLSAESGKVDAYARGGRKPSKRFGGRLEPFVTGQAALRQGRGGLPSLTDFTPVARLLPMQAQYEQLALASYFAELAEAAAQPDHADPQLLLWFVAAAELAGRVDFERLAVAKLAGELTWLAASGALADPTTCFDCGGTTEHGARWTTATAGPVCRSCAAPLPADASADLLLTVAALATQGIDDRIVAALGAAQPDVIEAAVGARVAELLPRPPRSLRGLQAEFSLAQRSSGC